MDRITGRFTDYTPALSRRLMEMIRTDVPFAWLRWADGDANNAAGGGPMGERLRRAAATWEASGDNLFVVVAAIEGCIHFRLPCQAPLRLGIEHGLRTIQAARPGCHRRLYSLPRGMGSPSLTCTRWIFKNVVSTLGIVETSYQVRAGKSDLWLRQAL